LRATKYLPIVAAAVLALTGCAAPDSGDFAYPKQQSRAIDHDIETTLPSADSNLRAVRPGLPAPVENGAGSPRF
jgi:hypothetical protein